MSLSCEPSTRESIALHNSDTAFMHYDYHASKVFIGACRWKADIRNSQERNLCGIRACGVLRLMHVVHPDFRSH